MALHRSVRFYLALLLIMASAADFAHAGMAHRDCRFPMVFEGAAVNVVVLPYRYAGNNYSLSNLGNRLSLLVKLDVLSHILEYGSVAAVQMEMPEGASPNDPACLPETVLPILLGTRTPAPSLMNNFADTKGLVNSVRPGHGLVLVWGLLYEEGDDIFVQTYARFLRRDRDETITLPVGGTSFSARPTSQILAFTPQKFSQSQLSQVEASYASADYVREQPSDSAHGEPLPALVTKCSGSGCDDSPVHAGFYVEERRGEWIRIQYMDPSRGQRKEGWIHASGGLAGAPLDEILPELKFIEGCAGYLRARVAQAEQPAQAMVAPALSVSQLNAFLQSNTAQPADITNAVALELAGIVEYLSGPASLSRAVDDFERARKMIPYDPNAISLAVGAQVTDEWRREGRCEQTVLKSQRLSAATAFSSDKAALSNLSSLYTLLLKAPESAPSAEDLPKVEVNAKLDALKHVAVAE